MRRIAVALLVMLAGLNPLPGWACGFHGQLPDLVAAHPRSISVALAVRDALDAAAVQPLPDAPPALGLMRATRLLQQFSPMVPATVNAAVPGQTVAVLLVESGLWTRYTLTREGAQVEPHINGPAAGERVLVTSETALNALVQGALDPARAQAMGLLVADRAA